MKVSVTKAASLADVSRTTLYTDMNSGKLSFHKTGKNKKEIEVSELERVYGPLQLNDNKVSSSVKSEQNGAKKSEQSDSSLVELAVLREKVGLLESERQRERGQLEERIGQLEETLKKSQDNQNNTTRLLEHYTKEDRGVEWQEAINSLEDRIANQEESAKEKEKELLSEKTDLEKANAVYRYGAIGLTILGLGIAALYGQGIITLPI